MEKKIQIEPFLSGTTPMGSHRSLLTYVKTTADLFHFIYPHLTKKLDAFSELRYMWRES